MKKTSAKSKAKSKSVTKAKPKAKAAAKPVAKKAALVKKAKSVAKPKKAEKPNLMLELINQKMEQQKSGGAQKNFSKFQRGKPRNENNSNVGPSWGGRKGN